VSLAGGLTQNSFGLNFCHLMIFIFFKMAKIKEFFLGFLVAKFQKKFKKSSDYISSYNM
jgi:hypothetical protein